MLKQSLCNATKLHIFEFGKSCGFLVDASSIAVGCFLIQWTEGKQDKPIAFASCKLTATQSAMSTIEREAFAVIYALRKFRNFVFDQVQVSHFQVNEVRDHETRTEQDLSVGDRRQAFSVARRHHFAPVRTL